VTRVVDDDGSKASTPDAVALEVTCSEVTPDTLVVAVVLASEATVSELVTCGIAEESPVDDAAVAKSGVVEGTAVEVVSETVTDAARGTVVAVLASAIVELDTKDDDGDKLVEESATTSVEDVALSLVVVICSTVEDVADSTVVVVVVVSG